MILTNGKVTVNSTTHEGLTIEYLENNEGISVHIGGNEKAVIDIHTYFSDSGLLGTIKLIGIDDNQGQHFYELQKPKELQLNLNPFHVSIGFTK